VTEDPHHLGSFVLRSFNDSSTSQHPDPPIIIPRILLQYAIDYNIVRHKSRSPNSRCMDSTGSDLAEIVGDDRS
jgi:hypothetical protein